MIHGHRIQFAQYQDNRHRTKIGRYQDNRHRMQLGQYQGNRHQIMSIMLMYQGNRHQTMSILLMYQDNRHQTMSIMPMLRDQGNRHLMMHGYNIKTTGTTSLGHLEKVHMSHHIYSSKICQSRSNQPCLHGDSKEMPVHLLLEEGHLRGESHSKVILMMLDHHARPAHMMAISSTMGGVDSAKKSYQGDRAGKHRPLDPSNMNLIMLHQCLRYM